MKVLIIEDEVVAAKRIQRMLEEEHPSVEVMTALTSIEDATTFLKNHTPDLILMDIHLADGLCFEIFERIAVEPPVIFTTAYDQYTLKAFKVNSVDYLLKPIESDELKFALLNFKNQKKQAVESLLQELKLKDYKERFLVKSGQSMISIETEKISYFHSKNKLTYLITVENGRYATDYTLEQVQDFLDPKRFKRINRNLIVSCKSIVKMDSYFNNRMMLHLNPPFEEDAIVSRFYLRGFKSWMGG